MAPDPASSKSRSSRHRSNDAQHGSGRVGESMERVSQRPESAKRKGERDGGEESGGRGTKRRHHGGVGDGGQDGTSGSASDMHRSSKRWRADNLETFDTPISIDRWDGGASDSAKENAFSPGKGKQESGIRTEEGIALKSSEAQLLKDGGDGEKTVRKHKASKTSLASDNRAITVMDLQETDLSVIDSNIRIKNKVSYRREAAFDFAEPEIEQSAEGNAEVVPEVPRSKKRWDKGGHKGESNDLDDAHIRANADTEGSLERDKENDRLPKGKHRGVDRDIDERILNARRSGEESRDFSAAVELAESGSAELAQNNDFKIQEEVRNIELEKELENRIRRRREESSDRERWRDDDREREEKRHQDSREERGRDERHRSRREKEKHSDRSERDKEYRQHREGSKVSDGRQRDDRYYESDREYRSHREDRYHRDRSKDHEDSGRGDRSRDSDHKDRKRGESASGYEGERRPRERSTKDDVPEKSYPTTTHLESSDGGRSDHRHKRAKDGDVESHGPERAHSRHRVRGGDSDVVAASDLSHDDRYRRSKEDRDAEGRYERSRGSPRDNDSMRGKGRGSSSWRGDGSSGAGEGMSSPRYDTWGGSPHSNRVDYASSPLLDDHQRSPRYRSRRSPSHADMGTVPRGKGSHGDWFEHSNSVSNSSGPHRRSHGSSLHMSDRRDRSKWHPGMEDEVKSFRASRSGDEARDVSLSPHRLHDQHHSSVHAKFPLHGQDNYSRGMGGNRGSVDGRGGGGWRAPSQAGSSVYEGGHLDHHGPDDLSPRDRNDRLRRLPMNRPPGSPMVRSQGPQGPQLSSLPVPPLAPLPPPPPFRPGIDNPAVLGPLSGGYDDTSGSREQGRGDRKGVPMRRGDHGGSIVPGDAWRGVNMGGNWNSRNQGPPPGPFPPQFGHPAAGGNVFPAMGQQFPGPPMFPGGGGRPPLDMGFGGGRFMGPGSHIGDAGDGYLGPGRGAGWHGHGEVDDGRGPPLLGPTDGWDGLGPHGDDRLRHGRMEWDRGPMGIRAWERDRERAMWEERARDGASDFMPHRPQLDPPPQNHAFPLAGGGWGAPRDPQVSGETKPRQERQFFETQDMKRKQDEGTVKPHVIKTNGGRRGIFSSGGRLSKFAASRRQSILSQLDISPDLAGKELYEEYRSLLPASHPAKADLVPEEESPLSEPADDDLDLEADAEAEALIASPNLLATLLPPLPDGDFEEALRLYMKPETESRLLRSLRGSFVLPFDPSTVRAPIVTMRFNRNSSGFLEPLSTGDGIPGEEFGEPTNVNVQLVNSGGGIFQEGPVIDDLDVEDKGGDVAADDFHSLRVEVAEYSDREFEAEMEDPLEDESVKDVQASGISINDEEVKPVTEDDNLKADATVHRESIDPVDIMVEKKEAIVEMDTDWPADVQDMEVAIPETISANDDDAHGVGAATTPGETETVNKLVVLKVDEDKDSSPVQTENVGVVMEEEAVNVEASAGLERISASDISIAEVQGGQELQFPPDSRAELLPAGAELDTVNAPDVSVAVHGSLERHFSPETRVEPVPVPAELERINIPDVSEAQFWESQELQFTPESGNEPPLTVASEPREIFKPVGDNFEGDVEVELGSDFVDTLTTIKGVNEGTNQEEWSLEIKGAETVGVDLEQDLPDSAAVGDLVEENQSKLEDPTAISLLEEEMETETNVKQKEIVEELPAPDPPETEEPQQEPTAKVRNRRTSSRLRAQQASEAQALARAQAAAEQESLDILLSQGAKKPGSRGKARSSQRRSKRRGSTH